MTQAGDVKVFLGRPKSGIYVYSSGGCGEDCCIRICDFYDADPDGPANIYLSVKQTRSLIKTLQQVVKDYEQGKETFPEINLGE